MANENQEMRFNILKEEISRMKKECWQYTLGQMGLFDPLYKFLIYMSTEFLLFSFYQLYYFGLRFSNELLATRQDQEFRNKDLGRGKEKEIP